MEETAEATTADNVACERSAEEKAKPSFTNRISSLYETLLAKTAIKKSVNGERTVAAGVGNNGADLDAKVSGEWPFY